jgi:hypothetical protein
MQNSKATCHSRARQHTRHNSTALRQPRHRNSTALDSPRQQLDAPPHVVSLDGARQELDRLDKARQGSTGKASTTASTTARRSLDSSTARQPGLKASRYHCIPRYRDTAYPENSSKLYSKAIRQLNVGRAIAMAIAGRVRGTTAHPRGDPCNGRSAPRAGPVARAGRRSRIATNIFQVANSSYCFTPRSNMQSSFLCKVRAPPEHRTVLWGWAVPFSLGATSTRSCTTCEPALLLCPPRASPSTEPRVASWRASCSSSLKACEGAVK